VQDRHPVPLCHRRDHQVGERHRTMPAGVRELALNCSGADEVLLLGVQPLAG
jgi:hypothetical protein